MRRYMKAFWILLILSVFHFALAAAVAVGEILKVHSNVVDVFKDGVAAWEKRMDSDDHWSTNEAYRKGGDVPGGDALGGGDEGVDDEGVKEEDMWGYDSWDLNEMGSDARGPDPHYNNPPEEESDDEDKDDGAKSDDKDDGAKSNDSDGGGNGNGNGGYDGGKGNSGDDGDDEGSGGDAMRSSQGSVENTNLGLESEHPAAPAPEHMSGFEKLLKDSLGFRPRNSGSGAVGTP